MRQQVSGSAFWSPEGTFTCRSRLTWWFLSVIFQHEGRKDLSFGKYKKTGYREDKRSALCRDEVVIGENGFGEVRVLHFVFRIPALLRIAIAK